MKKGRRGDYLLADSMNWSKFNPSEPLLQIAALWARKQHEVSCGKKDDDADRKRLFAVLNVSEAAAFAVVTSLLLSVLSPAVAAPVAAIIAKHLLVPAGGTICDYWSEKLDGMPA